MKGVNKGTEITEPTSRRRLLLIFIILGLICVGLMLSMLSFEVYKGITKGSFGADAIELICYGGLGSIIGLGCCLNALRRRVAESSWNKGNSIDTRMDYAMKVSIFYFMSAVLSATMYYVFLETKFVDPSHVDNIKSKVAEFFAKSVTYQFVKLSILMGVHGMLLYTVLIKLSMSVSNRNVHRFSRSGVDRVLLCTFSLTGGVLAVTAAVCGMYSADMPKNWIDDDLCVTMIYMSFFMVVTSIALKIFSVKSRYIEEDFEVENTTRNSRGNDRSGGLNARSSTAGRNSGVSDPEPSMADSKVEEQQEQKSTRQH